VRTPEPLKLVAFDSADDPLAELRGSAQGQYLRWYLADLDAKSVLVEPAYFDRDYLSEFAAFYCTSTAGYPNVCRRLHYFSEDIDRAALERAVAGDAVERLRLEKSYLGFVVLRPIPKTPSAERCFAGIPMPRRICHAWSSPRASARATLRASSFA
jgi:hypothetical protein